MQTNLQIYVVKYANTQRALDDACFEPARPSILLKNWAPKSADMEQQARVAFLRSQAQFLLYVSNKTELHQSQAPF